MNKLKEHKEEEVQEDNMSFTAVNGVKGILSGSFLSRERAVKVLPYLFFITFLGICYIANGYQTEKLVRKLYKTTNNVKELRSEYITTKSELMYISKQSQVARATENLGLRELVRPPKKIVISKEEKRKLLNE